MQIDWSTFLLEVVNFLVLIWILKRFLYQPVLAVIARRRAAIEAALGEARDGQRRAEALRAQYEGRLADWERERQGARAALERELEGERARALASLREAIDQEREKSRVQDERREGERRQRCEEQALALGARFATRLLERLAGPEVEPSILALVLEDLEKLPDEQRSVLRRAWEASNGPAEVVSARPLEAGPRAELEQALRGLLGPGLACEYRMDEALGAGLRISLGPWTLGANLQDELEGFADAARESG